MQRFRVPPLMGGGGVNWQIKNPEIRPTSPLALAGAVVAGPASGLMEMEMRMCLGVALICLA